MIWRCMHCKEQNLTNRWIGINGKICCTSCAEKEKKREQYYRTLLATGMFFEFFPQLTGNWDEDCDSFKVEGTDA